MTEEDSQDIHSSFRKDAPDESDESSETDEQPVATVAKTWGRPGAMEPAAGFVDPQDTLEMYRDALWDGMEPEDLPVTERTKVTAQAALQPFSYDVHVKLGMELMALRRQEANMRLDAEQFGEQLKRRAFIRDMLKRVAKEDNWVQYPASDLERINRALDRGVSSPKEPVQDPWGDDKDAGRAKSRPSGSDHIYAKWLEQRRKAPPRRAAFGTSVGREVAEKPAQPETGEDGGGTSRSRLDSGATLRPDVDRPAVVTTFGMAPRLMGPKKEEPLGLTDGWVRTPYGGVVQISSRTPSRAALMSRRSLLAGTSAMMGQRGSSTGGGGGPNIDGSQADGDIRRRVSYQHVAPPLEDEEGSGGEGAAAADGGGGASRRASEAESHGVRFISDSEYDEYGDGSLDLQDAAELLGLGGGGGHGRHSVMFGRTHSDILAAARVAGSSEPSATGPRPDWRTLLKMKREAAETEAPVEDPIAELRMSVRRGRSMTKPQPVEDGSEEGEEGQGAELPLPEVEAPLGALEAAVQAVESLGDEQLKSFVAAVSVAVAAADAAAAGPSTAADAAAARELTYSEAAKAAESWIAAAAEKLEAAREGYSSAHAAKLDSISSIVDLHRQIDLLREWVAGAEHRRLTAAAAALAAQRGRLESAAAASEGVRTSPAFARLLDHCTAASEEMDAMAAAVAAAEEEALARLEEREQRRAALRLIEDECVRLAEEMAAREETDRLAQLMRREAEAEQAMAEAKDEEEAKDYAMTAAMLMGEEEWVLEREARLAAVKMAERDAQRLASLRQAEEDKARAAEQKGQSFDKGLLEELMELEEAAKREVALRKERLLAAAAELAHFEQMIKHQETRRTRHTGAPPTPMTDPAADAEAAGLPPVAASAEPPLPSVSEGGEAAAVAEQEGTTAETETAEVGPAEASEVVVVDNPDDLVRAAVEAVVEVFSKAASIAAAEPPPPPLLPAKAVEAEGQASSADVWTSEAQQRSPEVEEMVKEHEAELARYSRAAQQRLAAAKAALEAVRRINELHQSAIDAKVAEPPMPSAAEAAVGEASTPSVAESGALEAPVARPPPQAAAATAGAASVVRFDTASLEVVRGVVRQETVRLAALINSGSMVVRAGQSELQEVLEACEDLATLIEEVAAPAPPPAAEPASESHHGTATAPSVEPSASGAVSAGASPAAEPSAASALVPPAGQGGLAGQELGSPTQAASPPKPTAPSGGSQAPASQPPPAAAAAPVKPPAPAALQPPLPAPQPVQLLQVSAAQLQPPTSAGATPLLPLRTSRPGAPPAGAAATGGAVSPSPRSDSRVGPLEPLRRIDPRSSAADPAAAATSALQISGYQTSAATAASSNMNSSSSQSVPTSTSNAVNPPARHSPHGSKSQHQLGPGGGQLTPPGPLAPLQLPAVSALSTAGGDDSSSRRSLLVASRPGANELPRSVTSEGHLPRIHGASSSGSTPVMSNPSLSAPLPLPFPPSSPSPSHGAEGGQAAAPSSSPSAGSLSLQPSTSLPLSQSQQQQQQSQLAQQQHQHHLHAQSQAHHASRQSPQGHHNLHAATGSASAAPYLHSQQQQQQHPPLQQPQQHLHIYNQQAPSVAPPAVATQPVHQAHQNYVQQPQQQPLLPSHQQQQQQQQSLHQQQYPHPQHPGGISYRNPHENVDNRSVPAGGPPAQPGPGRGGGGGGGSPTAGHPSGGAAVRQSWPLGSQNLAAPVAAPAQSHEAHGHMLRRHAPAGSGGSSGGGAANGGLPQAPSMVRGTQLHQPRGGVAAAAAPPPPPPAPAPQLPVAAAQLPPSTSVFTIGDMSYTQWVSGQQDVTPKALEAARRVDEMLSRLPPELHSVLLNAAELLTLGGANGNGSGGHDGMQLQPLAAAAAAITAAAEAGGGAGGAGSELAQQLQTLPPVVSKYILAQMQRLYNGGGKSTSGAASGGSSGGGAAVAAATSTGEDSLRIMELLNQLLPAMSQSMSQVRNGTRIAGGGAGSAPPGPQASSSSVGFEARSSPLVFGAMQGAPLRSNRKTRSMGDGDGYGPRLRNHKLSLSAHAVPGGGKTVSGGGSATAAAPANNGRRGGRAPGGVKSGGGAGGGGRGSSMTEYDLLRHQHESLIAMDGWMVRGVTYQQGGKPPGPGPGGIQEGGSPARNGAALREAFLPPLGNKLAAVRF